MALTAPPQFRRALSVLAAGAVFTLLGTTVEAQRFRPGFGPAGRPNLPGMPGNPGMGPNIGPGGPNNPFGPQTNNPFGPQNNNPFGPPQNNGPLGPGMGMGPPAFEHVWTCSNCGRELGRGKSLLDKPNLDHCPFCGAKFINGGGFGPRLMNPPSAQGGMPGRGPITPTPPVNSGPPNSSPFQVGHNSSWSDNSGSDTASDEAVGKTLAIVGGATFVGLGLVGGIVFAVVQSTGGKKRRRRRRRYEDDDYDEYDRY